MLAQNFKSAADLGITDEEFSAAISVLGMLERGELTHRITRNSLDEYIARSPYDFNMECSGKTNECGTVACIGGWMAILMGYKGAAVNLYVNNDPHPGGLIELFWKNTNPITTTDQAATALRSYLTTGDARWDLAVVVSP